MEKTKIGSLRAIRVEEDLVLADVSPGALDGVSPKMLLGRPDAGEWRAVFPRDSVPDGARVLRTVRLADWYGWNMRAVCVGVLCAMEQAGMEILGVSLSDGRMSTAFGGRWDEALPERIFCFTL